MLLLLLLLLTLLLDDVDDVVVVFGAGEGINMDDELLLLLLWLLLLLLHTIFSLGFTASVALKLSCRVTSSRVLFNALIASPLSNGFVSIGSILISVSDLMCLLFISTVADVALSFCGVSTLICCSNASAEAIINSLSLSFSSLMADSLLELLLLLLRLLSELRRRWECEFDELLEEDDCICVEKRKKQSLVS